MATSRRVLVIGAGVTGATVARTLAATSVVPLSIHVWEKGRGVGGRLSTTRVPSSPSPAGSGDAPSETPAPRGADMGAQYLSLLNIDESPHRSLFGGLLLDPSLLRPVASSAFKNSPDPEHDRKHHFVAPSGLSRIVRFILDSCASSVRPSLASAFSLTLSTQTQAVGVFQATAADPDASSGESGAVDVADSSGDLHRFDAVVVTAPVEQAVNLLSATPDTRAHLPSDLVAQLEAVTYSTRFAATVSYPWSPEFAAAAASIADGGIGEYVPTRGDGSALDGAARYVSVESRKALIESESKSEGDIITLLIHSSVPFGLLHADLTPEERTDHILPAMKNALAETFPLFKDLFSTPPVHERVMKWRYSQVHKSPFTSGAVALPSLPVVLAGDAFSGASGFENALDSGVAAAELVLRKLEPESAATTEE